MTKFKFNSEEHEFKLWDQFKFVGDYIDNRKIWIVGESFCGPIVADLRHEGELTPDNIPDNARLYAQIHLPTALKSEFFDWLDRQPGFRKN
jgi:hypothetical protein